MLPAGFNWERLPDGLRLRLGERTVAFVTELDGGRCRVTTNVGLATVSHQFFDRFATGERYVEAWARKWEQRIRADGEQSPPLYRGDSMRAPADLQPTRHVRRRRR